MAHRPIDYTSTWLLVWDFHGCISPYCALNEFLYASVFMWARLFVHNSGTGEVIISKSHGSLIGTDATWQAEPSRSWCWQAATHIHGMGHEAKGGDRDAYITARQWVRVRASDKEGCITTVHLIPIRDGYSTSIQHKKQHLHQLPLPPSLSL